MTESEAAGTLFVVATPIGNLEDITLRALRTLGEVDLIAAEDTRRTSKLLAHYEISCPLTSYREHNEASATPKLIARLSGGDSIALVTDAGTPGISDPGARLVAAAHESGIRVVPLPGPSAVAAALSVCGIQLDQFVFMGFPPAAGSKRRAWFRQLAVETRPIVVFEAPHRIRKTVHELASVCERPIYIGRELSKIHETLVISPNTTDADALPMRGEYVIVLGKSEREERKSAVDTDRIYKIFSALDASPNLARQEALDITGAATGTSPREVKKIVKNVKFSVK